MNEYLPELPRRKWVSCALHRLATTLLNDQESAQDNQLFVALPSIQFIHRLQKFFLLVDSPTNLSKVDY